MLLIDLDQSTLAYMTAALEAVCRKIPPEKDSHELRKKIADAMVDCAKRHRRTFVDFEEAGMMALNDKGETSSWLNRIFRLSHQS